MKRNATACLALNPSSVWIERTLYDLMFNDLKRRPLKNILASVWGECTDVRFILNGTTHIPAVRPDP